LDRAARRIRTALAEKINSEFGGSSKSENRESTGHRFNDSFE
jgi:hypothetical protein